MDERWMRAALDEAKLALAEGELPVGCAIVKDGELVAAAHNERERTNDPTAHAEVLAIRRAAEKLESWRLEGCELYVTLEPCPMCAGAISQSRVARLIYGARDPQYGCAGSVYRIPEDPAFHHFCKSDGGVLADDCAALLKEFFENRRTQPHLDGAEQLLPCLEESRQQFSQGMGRNAKEALDEIGRKHGFV